ncbi:MAG: NAD-dependent deacylase [Bdellovibrionota bacterium]
MASIVILTGAGISAESGIKTFRDHDGLWENHRIEDVASIDGYLRNPELVQQFYNARRAQLSDPLIRPNAAHEALARLEKLSRADVLVVTQNVDDLHERAGSKALIHIHGELAKVRCQESGAVHDWRLPIAKETSCPCCGKTGTLRPHIVWFGEMPLELDRTFSLLENCDVFAAIGTSGQVYPAAGFVMHVPPSAQTFEINPNASDVSLRFRELRRGPATVEVPAWVDEMLALFGSR